MFEFNLLQVKWWNIRWLALGIIETPDNWGALLHVCWLWGGEWEFDFLYIRMLLRWIGRKFVP